MLSFHICKEGVRGWGMWREEGGLQMQAHMHLHLHVILILLKQKPLFSPLSKKKTGW